MRRLILGAAALLLTVAASPNPPAPVFNLNSSTFTSTGSTSSRTLANRGADIVNVRDYGAVCDGSTDDSAAINAAIAVIRTNQKGRIDFTGCNTRVNSSLNFTGLTNKAITVEGGGAQILCATSGTPCIDALGSIYVRWHNIYLLGASTPALSPSYGIQIGRINTTSLDSGGASQAFERFYTAGNFTKAAFYNFSGEVVHFSHVLLANGYAGSSCYTLVEDGLNHFNITSAFVTENAPVDTQQSFNENTFVNASVSASGGCIPVWLGGTRHHKWVDSYIQNTQTGYEVVLWTDGTAVMELDMDAHMESAPTDIFFIQGNVTAPVFNGLRFNDHWNFATNSLFKLDTNITAVTLHGLDLNIAKFNSGSTVKTFDDPTKWTVDGRVWLPSSLNWNVSTIAAWQGWANLAGVISTSSPGMLIGTGQQGALGVSSFGMGIQNQLSGNSSFVLGQSNTSTGNTSVSIGSDTADRGRFGSMCYGNGHITTDGDAQRCTTILRGSASSTSAVQLVANGTGSGGLTTCVNIPDNTAYGLQIYLHARDNTTAGKDYDWYLPNGIMTRDSGAATTAVSLGTPVTTTRGTTTGAAVSAAADTTNGCLNLSFTPPSGNTDTWHVSARVETIEVQ